MARFCAWENFHFWDQIQGFTCIYEPMLCQSFSFNQTRVSNNFLARRNVLFSPRYGMLFYVCPDELLTESRKNYPAIKKLYSLFIKIHILLSKNGSKFKVIPWAYRYSSDLNTLRAGTVSCWIFPWNILSILQATSGSFLAYYCKYAPKTISVRIQSGPHKCTIA